MTQKWSLLEEISDDSMQMSADLLKFSEPTPVAEEKRFQEDIAAQTNNKFALFLFMLLHRMPKNSKK